MKKKYKIFAIIVISLAVASAVLLFHVRNWSAAVWALTAAFAEAAIYILLLELIRLKDRLDCAGTVVIEDATSDLTDEQQLMRLIAEETVAQEDALQAEKNKERTRLAALADDLKPVWDITGYKHDVFADFISVKKDSEPFFALPNPSHIGLALNIIDNVFVIKIAESGYTVEFLPKPFTGGSRTVDIPSKEQLAQFIVAYRKSGDVDDVCGRYGFYATPKKE